MKAVTLFTLEVIFIATIVALSITNGVVVPPAWLVVAMVFACMRAAHTISYNEVAEWLRKPFCYVTPDSCGAGSDVHARTNRGGFIEAIGGLLSCPSACTPTWCALGLYAAWLVWPAFGTTLVVVLAVAGGAEALHYLTNALEWAGRLARVSSGKIAPDANVPLLTKDTLNRIRWQTVLSNTKSPTPEGLLSEQGWQRYMLDNIAEIATKALDSKD